MKKNLCLNVLSNFKKRWKIFSNFVASEYLNFIRALGISFFRDDCYIRNVTAHGLRTPNEGINQRNLKIWANGADKTCFGCT